MAIYNGWDNYETWLLNCEMFDSMHAQEIFELLGYEQGQDLPSAYEVGVRLKDFVAEYISDCSGEPVVKRWAMVALDSVNYLELGTHLVFDIVGEGYFTERREEAV